MYQMGINHEKPDNQPVEPVIDEFPGTPAIDYFALADNDLLKLFVEENVAEAMHQFVKRHELKVATVCRSVTRCSQTADDAFQATFLAAVKNANRLRSVDSHSGWLCRVAYNASLKALKLKHREKTLLSSANLDKAIPDPVPETWQVLEQRETIDALLTELFKLPKHYQDCLVLYYFDGQSRKSIALRLGKSVSSVKAMLQRGKSLLRSKLVSRGLAPGTSFAVLAFAANSLASASQLKTATLSTCNHYASGSIAAIPSTVLKISEVGSVIWNVKLTATLSVAAAASFLCLMVTVIGAFPMSESRNTTIQLANANDSAGSTAMPVEFESRYSQSFDQEIIAKQSQQIQQNISQDAARLQQVTEWIEHKSRYLEESNSEDERKFLSEIIGELNVESQGLSRGIEEKSNLLQELESHLSMD